MPPLTVRILVVDEYEPFRRFVALTLGTRPEFKIVGYVLDGAEAVRQAQELRPDLILLDVGLPRLNGIEAARQIRQCVPESKIMFVTQDLSDQAMREAFRLGALAYIVKSKAVVELLPAIDTVLAGRLFLSDL
jgi:DNA-binding NarL/FixJ family response regulator